ncbi:MAG: IS1380 family transposase [Acidimicrobiales bacterium]
MPSSRSASRLSVTFDDDHAVADAGLALVAVLSEKLGLESLASELVDIHPFPGRRVATLVHAMVAGASFIDDADMLRSGATAEVLGHRVMAPSTLGTFLRRCSFGHVRQLDKLAEILLTRAWSAGAGPGAEAMTIDIDSTIAPVHGDQKQGAGFGYTKVLGYHPLLGTRADTGEVLHIRFRKGSANSGRGAERFVRELVGRVRRAGSSGPLTLRADSGFYSQFVIKACRDHKVAYSVTAPQNSAVKRAIDAITEDAWTPIDYTDNGEAWVSETPYGDGHRLVVRRTKLAGPQPALFPTFRYHAFITNREGDAVTLDADHRRHAVVELAIRDLKDGGLAHCPSGNFSANGAWAVLATIAHNLIRWVGALGLKITGLLVAKTIRRRFLALPGRITRSARRRQLHLPTKWPWAEQWTACFERFCALRI